ncbi:ABC transporter permease [Virgibacillus halodenitrificans]|uniref:ABC transporter permease n=1 Tax=Virgibacillus halodenitrificans TaxID=1482 RepID=UPI000312D71E|nr:ABC transporter permease [Virgibacillus halodenitrificans]
MTFRQFVVNNVLRNKRLYAAYFLSSMFTVMIFFTFAVFAFHPALNGEGINPKAIYGMGVAGGIIYLFSLFFVLYSMSSFLQSRKKEFGLLMLQGMSMRQIRMMVFLENMLIGVLATVIGILIGLLFAKAILLIAENVLIIEQALHFYFPILAILITLGSFFLLFLFISFFVTFFLRSKKLTELIKGSTKPKTEPKASLLLTVIAAILLIAGYVTALYVKGVFVIYVMLPVIVVVTIGTYLFFTQLSVFIIGRLKRRKRIFWSKTNMLLLSDLSFRMKDNARTFFMVAIISTVAFSAIGTLFGFQTYLTGGVKEANPYTFSYTPNDDDGKSKKPEDVKTIERVLEENKIDASRATTDMKYYDIGRDREVLIASESIYNTFADLLDKKQVQIEEGKAMVVKENFAMISDPSMQVDLIDKPLKLKNGEEIQPTREMNSIVLPEMQAYYVVSNEDYKQLPKPVYEMEQIFWKAADGQEDAVIQAGLALSDQIPPYKFQAIDAMIYTINKSYGPILFIGLFIGIVFFVSAGSFLYFRLYSDLDEDKAKFKSIAKLGLTDRELGKVINRQTGLLFFAPIIVALLHGAVALTALSHLFDYNLVKESSMVLGGFLLIQIVYFILVRFLYIKQIKSAL